MVKIYNVFQVKTAQKLYHLGLHIPKKMQIREFTPGGHSELEKVMKLDPYPAPLATVSEWFQFY